MNRNLLLSAIVAATFFLGSHAASSQRAAAPQPPSKLVNGYEPKWWKEAVVYQIYPRSFQDSNGDGIGDLKGITQHLDYLQKLGINVIWLSPHYDSPNADNGYDIRDYRKVMNRIRHHVRLRCTILKGVKQRHMRLIIDLVVNHTSDEHRWFIESRKSLNVNGSNPYRDYYHLASTASPARPTPTAIEPSCAQTTTHPSSSAPPGRKIPRPPTNTTCTISPSKQPDLNWDNPKVREEVYSLMKFWLDKGVDGFRMDVIPLISKQPGLPDLTPQQLSTGGFVALWANGPKRDQYLQEMNRDVLSRYDDMSVGEAIGIDLAQENKIVDDRCHELNEIFNFDAIRLNRDGIALKPLDLPAFKAIYTKHAELLTRHLGHCLLSNTTAPASSPPSATTRQSSASPPPSSSKPCSSLFAARLISTRAMNSA